MPRSRVPALVVCVAAASLSLPLAAQAVEKTGTNGDDVVFGTAGADVLRLRGGDDFAIPDAGDDYVDGGPGKDQVSADLGDDRLLGGDGADELYGEEDDDTIVGGAGPDSLDGGEGADVLRGSDGKDTIYLGSGRDRAYGEAGNDTMVAGFFVSEIDNLADYFYGGRGNDVIYPDRNDRVVGGAGRDDVVIDTKQKPALIDLRDGERDVLSVNGGGNLRGIDVRLDKIDHIARP